MLDPLQRLYRTRLLLLATVMMSFGVAFLFAATWFDHVPQWRWMSRWPISEIGSCLFTTGLLGLALHYFDSEDAESRATERLERVIASATPAMRDAVIDGFAFRPQELARVATVQTLDRIVTNGLSIRLADAEFGAGIYHDLRRQVIDRPERLREARTMIRLSTDKNPVAGRSPMFVTTVRWEFDVIPRYVTRRFVCLCDLEEFRDLDQDSTATSAWYIRTEPGVDAGAKEAFELMDFSIDGRPRPIRRSSKTGSQTYSVNIGQDVIDADQSVTVAYTYRTLLPRSGRLLQIRVDQPTRNLNVELDYSDTDLTDVDVLDFLSTSHLARIATTPAGLPSKIVGVSFDGWVLPRKGVVFAWR